MTLLSALFLSHTLWADTLPKQTLLNNGQLRYNDTQERAQNLNELFSKGHFYGRLRSHTFYYQWDKEDSTHNSHLISALGGSIAYKSALYKKFDLFTALYFSQAFFNNSKDPVSLLKSGKDALSRFDYLNYNRSYMAVLGQAYMRYNFARHTSLKLGRQLVEGFYTKSNDTKMIPNTFDGLSFKYRSKKSQKLHLSLLSRQKLRDHTQAHGVLVYGDANSSSASKPTWSQNDDSAMHKGLSYTVLKNAGLDPYMPLITGDYENHTIKNLKLSLAFYSVPTLLSQVMGELNYTFAFKHFTFIPGFRYIQQFDDQAGAIGGAAYNASATSLSGYKNPNSLNSSMFGLRALFKFKQTKLNLAMTQISDQADLITPWRGFPTASYTRSMGRYNWQANTKSYRIELVQNANRLGVYKKAFVQASFLYTDADESKGYYDENYYYIGFIQNPTLAFQWRLRLGYAQSQNLYGSGLDARFECNYLF